MSTHDRDHLDEAIDHVAARMTAVSEDAHMTERIVAALPEASLFHWWLRSAWAPRLAAVALVVIGAALWNRNGLERPGPAPAAPPALVAFAPVVVPNRPITSSVERLERLEPVEPVEVVRVDHERSLPAIEAMTALGMSSLTPRDLPVSEPLALRPIEIGDLALTAESFSPR